VSLSVSCDDAKSCAVSACLACAAPNSLARIAGTTAASVNLIPLNEAPDLEFRRPAREKVLAFQAILRKRGVETFIRRSRGDEISAACGQLRKQWAAPPGIDLAALGIC
jgi:23S rRNA (adenine2503-C2)-methyltransferase